MLDTLKKWIPLVDALSRGYGREDMRGDLAAGLTTAVMLIPQGMAYAMLAGLPPIIGLYASTLPIIIYALFGTSRQLAVGPVAMVSLLTASGIGALGIDGGTEQYVAYAVLLALMVGVIQLGMGLARMGFLVNFLSHPVISGFTSAAALIIGLSQLKHLLGIDLHRSHHIHEILLEAGRKASDIHPTTVLIGALSIAALLGLKAWNPKFPRALAVVAVATVSVWALGLVDQGVKIVADVPAGLPSPTVPTIDLDAIASLWPTALAISLVGFMESISVAKAFARKHRYDVEPNQELIGLGAANLAGAAFSGYPVTGGFSRTAVNDQAGARTGVAGIITASVIILTLLFLTPLFYYLPKAVLAAIIMTAVFGLIDIKEVKHLWQVKRGDLALLLITFVATLSVGIEAGVLTGVAASLIFFVVRTTRPHTAVLGQLPGTEVYRNMANFPEAVPVPGVLAVRVDASFYFGNVTFLKETLKKLRAEAKTPVFAVVMDASSINYLDSSADSALHEIVEDFRGDGIEVYFAGVKGPVREVMQRSHFEEKLTDARFFHTVHQAIQGARAERERKLAKAAEEATGSDDDADAHRGDEPDGSGQGLAA